MQGNYSVTVEEYAERHFIKGFQKKYKDAWTVTLRAVVAELERMDMLLETDRAEIIVDAGDIKIIKTKFRVAGTKESAKTSGNRCIVKIEEKSKSVSVLLMYTKTDLPATNETAAWMKMVKDNYLDCKHLF